MNNFYKRYFIPKIYNISWINFKQLIFTLQRFISVSKKKKYWHKCVIIKINRNNICKIIFSFYLYFPKISSTQEKKIKSTLAGRDTKKKSYTKIFSKISYSSNKFILSASKVRPPFFHRIYPAQWILFNPMNLTDRRTRNSRNKPDVEVDFTSHRINVHSLKRETD